MIDTMLADFGNRNGLDDLRLDDNGICRLVVDDVLDVDIELYGDQVSFFAVVGPMDSVGPGMLRMMMGANLVGEDTGDATLAVDEISESVVLCRRLPADGLTYPAFERALEGFLQGFRRWRQELGGHVPADDMEPHDAASAVDPTMTILRL